MNHYRIHICCIFLPLALLYILALPSGLPDYDSGEFAIIAAKGGIAHPPGYPLLCLLLRFAALFQQYLPLIFLISFVSVLCTYFSAMLMGSVLYEYTKNHAATALGIYGTYLSCSVWRAATCPEPFALNLLLASGCIYAFWKILHPHISAAEKRKYFALSGLTFGLGFCNHHSLAFLLPFAILVWFSQKTDRLSCFLYFCMGSLAGLLPLFYFFSDLAQGPYMWGDWTEPFQRLFTHLFRKEYGSLSLIPNSQGTWYNAPILFLHTLPKDLSLLFFVFALAGLLFAQRFTKEKSTCFPNINLFQAGIGISILCTGGVFIAMFGIGTSEWEKSIAERFFALPMILLSFPIALFSLRFQEIWPKKNLQILLVTILILFHGLYQWPFAERRNETFYEAHIRNVLNTVEENAVIVTAADANYFGILYGQHVLGMRPDVVIFQSELWSTGWYVKQFLGNIGLPIHPSYKDPTVLLSHLMQKRPVYILDQQQEINTLLQKAYPCGPLIRLLKPDESAPSPYALYEKNIALYQKKMEMPDLEKKRYFTTWEKGLLTYYQRTWQIMADTFAAYGDKKMEDVCRKNEILFAPVN